MAKLRLGEIELDSGQAGLGVGRGAPPLPRSATTPLPAADEGLLTVLAGIPIPGLVLLAVGAVVFASAAVWLGLAPGPLDAWSFATRGGLLVGCGLGIGALGALKWASECREREEKAARVRAEVQKLLAPLRALLPEPSPHQTIDWIENRVQRSRAEVVRALAALQANGELEEDLDPATGQFFYWLAPRPS